MLHSVYGRPAAAVTAQLDRLLGYVGEKLPVVAEHFDAARADVLVFTGFPKDVWVQIWSNNRAERLNREIRRSTDSVGIFPTSDSIVRLVCAALAEQADDWAEGRCCLGLDVLARCRLAITTTTAVNEVTTEVLPAVTSEGPPYDFPGLDQHLYDGKREGMTEALTRGLHPAGTDRWPCP